MTDKTPDGKEIKPEWVRRTEGTVLRIMIIEPRTGATLYGYQLNKGETQEEAIQKWKDGRYAYHKG